MAEKFVAVQTSLQGLPRKEYSTTEAKCRALRAARTEALDRLDELISSGEQCPINEDWNDDITAAKELIVTPPLQRKGGLNLGSTCGEDQGVVGSVL
jgi:hypothetical protein